MIALLLIMKKTDRYVKEAVTYGINVQVLKIIDNLRQRISVVSNQST